MKVSKIFLFGSFARGCPGPKSDVDLMVTFSQPIGFFRFYDVKVFLEKILNRPVDLVVPDAIRPEFNDQIEKEKILAA